MKLTSVAVLALFAVSTACGGDSAGLSTSQYGDQLNDICRTADREIGDLDEPTSLDDLSAYADDASQVVQDAVKDIKKLPLPGDKSYASDAKDLIASLEDQVDLVDDIARAAGDGDQAEVTAKSEKLAEAAEESAGLADDLDAKRCALAPMSAAAVAAPVDTIPVETVPVETVPPITLPPVTVPPQTVPDTTPLTPTDDNKTVELLVPQLSPAGAYSFEDVTAEALSGFQALLGLGPVVAGQPGTIGGVTVYDDAGNGFGRVFVYVSTGTLEPGSADEVYFNFTVEPSSPANFVGYEGFTYQSDDGTSFFIGVQGDVIAWVVAPTFDGLEPSLQAVVESIVG
jgi:hypothetical protein